jgi:hypothetical protein
MARSIGRRGQLSPCRPDLAKHSGLDYALDQLARSIGMIDSARKVFGNITKYIEMGASSTSGKH